MRILVVNDRLYPDFIGGVEKRNHDLAAALATLGHEVTLVGFGNGPAVLPTGVRIHSLGPLGPLYNGEGRRSTTEALRFAWNVARLDLDGYDAVEASNIPYVHLFPLALRCIQTRTPLLVTWYEYWGPYWKTYVGLWKAPVYRTGEWIAAQLGDGVVATSGLTSSRLAKRRLRDRTVTVVPCGIDMEQLRTSEPDRQARRGRLVFAGRLIREKRLDLVFAAMQRLPARLDARLTVFGEGPERQALEALAGKLGISSRVEFRGHVEDATQVWREVAGAQVAVQPSSREGFGLFPLEAMSLGLPVVYCRSEDSAISELVRDGLEGLCTAPEPASLAIAIERLLSDEAFRSALGGRARLRAVHYDRAVTAVQIEAILRPLVNPHARVTVAWTPVTEQAPGRNAAGGNHLDCSR